MSLLRPIDGCLASGRRVYRVRPTRLSRPANTSLASSRLVSRAVLFPRPVHALSRQRPVDVPLPRPTDDRASVKLTTAPASGRGSLLATARRLLPSRSNYVLSPRRRPPASASARRVYACPPSASAQRVSPSASGHCLLMPSPLARLLAVSSPSAFVRRRCSR
ncbi:hypothetical protein BD626DRAFT_463767 [Schizophyllum amplum]|uniref:Uncharacterized protein n=1 Tax=Schizophyllum amplum TaxID=97359 RepID=A0A550C0Q3_9AGAR|nr:hypothetical protein BD626DRAFT_463767 [Auriculariopsis ampla]